MSPQTESGSGGTARQPAVDLTRATEANKQVADAVHRMFEYQPWDEGQQEKGGRVRTLLEAAYLGIIQDVPPCPTRTVALRKITEARMDCNAAITHRGGV
jgi:hypothetical protein